MSIFHKEFVKTGEVPVEVGKFFNKMFIKRSEGDYEDFKRFEFEEVKEYLENAKKFIENSE